MPKKTMRKTTTDHQDLRDRARAFMERTGMTQDEFARRLGKQSGSSWTGQFLSGRIKGRADLLAAVEALISPPPPAPAPPPPPAPDDDPAEWPTALIAEKLRATAKALGIDGRSIFTLAADRLDTQGRFLHRLAQDVHALTTGTPD